MSLHQARGVSALDASCFCGAAFEPSNRIIFSRRTSLGWVRDVSVAGLDASPCETFLICLIIVFGSKKNSIIVVKKSRYSHDCL